MMTRKLKEEEIEDMIENEIFYIGENEERKILKKC